jgi:hypothetical protein
MTGVPHTGFEGHQAEDLVRWRGRPDIGIHEAASFSVPYRGR